VLARSVLPFVRAGRYEPIIIVVPPGDLEKASDVVKGHLPGGCARFIEGGSTRQESVFMALKELARDPPELVLIHDGARPWVTGALIEGVERGAARSGACIPVIRPTEAVKRVADTGAVLQSLNRDDLGLAQTPQGFAFRQIYAAHERAAGEGRIAADDAELYEVYAGTVLTIPGDAANRKITFAHDLQDVTPEKSGHDKAIAQGQGRPRAGAAKEGQATTPPGLSGDGGEP
jgi:2-C-methyl-D-erythritol 4-phosphate cytidylyltransferase